MSNNVIYGLIGFFIGGIFGGGIMGHICAGEYKKRIEALEEENDALRKERNELKDETLDIREKAANAAEIRTPTLTDEDFKREPFTQYEKLSKAYQSDSFDKHFETRVGPSDDEGEKDIRIISEEEFVENMNYMDQGNLTYYQLDDVLVDSENEPVTNPESVIGSAAADLLTQTERESIYVANEEDEIIYEIIVNRDMAFYRDIMGSGY